MKRQRSEETEDVENYGESKLPKIHKIQSTDNPVYLKVLKRIKILTLSGLPPKEIYRIVKNENKEVLKDEIIQDLIEQEQKNYGQHQRRLLEEKRNLNLQMISAVPEEEYKLHSIFRGDTPDKLLALYYLLFKHDNVCLHLPAEYPKYDPSKIGIEWKCTSSGGEEEKFNLEIHSDLSWASGCTKRFIIFPLSLRDCKQKYGHANMLVYDKKMNTLERFEPHGSHVEVKESSFDYDYSRLDTELATYFSKLFPGMKYLPSMNICPRFGLQTIENFEEYSGRVGDPGGFCAAWSLFYLDSRLSNPDIPPSILLDLLLHKLTEMGKKKLIDFIRAYSNFLLQEGLRSLSSSSTKTRTWISPVLLEEYLSSAVRQRIEMRKRSPIKVLDGTPWTLSSLKDHFKTKEVEAKRKGDHLPWIWYDIDTLLEDSYEKTANKLKEKISSLSGLDVSNIFFIGEHRWLSSDKDSKNYGRDLFENTNVDKYYVSNEDDILTYVLSMLLDVSLLEIEKFIDNSDENEIEKLLNMLTINQTEKTIDAVISTLLTMLNEHNHTNHKYDDRRTNNAQNFLITLWKKGYSSPLDYVKRAPEIYQSDLFARGATDYKFTTEDKELTRIYNFFLEL